MSDLFMPFPTAGTLRAKYEGAPEKLSNQDKHFEVVSLKIKINAKKNFMVNKTVKFCFLFIPMPPPPNHNPGKFPLSGTYHVASNKKTKQQQPPPPRDFWIKSQFLITLLLLSLGGRLLLASVLLPHPQISPRYRTRAIHRYAGS